MNCIVILLGSPRRNGNSSILARQIGEGAKDRRAEVETVFLSEKNIRPCQSCYYCQDARNEGCAINDDMQQIYKELIRADAWVVASPTYCFNMSAQVKIVIDRLFALFGYGSKPVSGKKVAIAMSYGDSDPLSSGCINALRCFQDCFRYAQAEIVGIVHGSAMDAGEIRKNKALMERARELGRELAEC